MTNSLLKAVRKIQPNVRGTSRSVSSMVTNGPILPPSRIVVPNIPKKTIVSNIKNHLFDSLSKKKIKAKFPITTDLIEEYEFTMMHGKWNPNVSGPDGQAPRPFTETVEIKCQLFQINSTTKKGPFKLKGRGKFGTPSKLLYNKKLIKDELIVQVGYDTDGEVYYRMSYRFSAIEQHYYNYIGSTNCDVYPYHFTCHESFKMHYIHRDIKNLQFSRRRHKMIADEFYQFLCNFPKKQIVPISKAFLK